MSLFREMFVVYCRNSKGTTAKFYTDKEGLAISRTIGYRKAGFTAWYEKV